MCCAYDGKEKAASFNIKCRLTLQKWLILMYCWAREYPVGDAAEEAEVQQKTAIDVYQWLREVCTTRLITTGPIVLGGPGIVVQIDESLFGISLRLCIYPYI